jgi:hypothetical protein
MLAVHRIFQMIFGIIVSVMILYFLISYSANYSNAQKALQRGEILNAFSDDVRNVYLTGVPLNFTYFSKYDFSSCSVKYQDKGLPVMECAAPDFPEADMDTPVIFHPGNLVYIGRDNLDYGWWAAGFAEAMPSITFIFNPIDNTDASWGVMQDMVAHLPDTSDDWSLVRVDFAFCDGSLISPPCGGMCSKTDFLSVLGLDHSGLSFSPCASMKKNTRIIIISQSCSSDLPPKDLCVTPPNSNGVGNAYLKGSGRIFVWKDPLDLVALAVGGSEKDIFGKTLGEKIFDYKNSVLMERLSSASQVISRRSILIASESPEGCGDLYAELSQVLDRIPGKDYRNVGQMNDLNMDLNQAKGIYQQIADRGCERGEYGA